MLLNFQRELGDSFSAILYKAVFYENFAVKGNVIYALLGLAFYSH